VPDVLGCPIRQEVDAVIIATASGCGLEKGVVDRMAEFVVDVKGETGDLLAEVRGQLGLTLILAYYFVMIPCPFLPFVAFEILGKANLLHSYSILFCCPPFFPSTLSNALHFS